MATVTRGASGAGCNAAHPVPTAGPNVATTTATLAGDSRPAPGRLSEVRTKEGETTAAGLRVTPPAAGRGAERRPRAPTAPRMPGSRKGPTGVQPQSDRSEEGRRNREPHAEQPGRNAGHRVPDIRWSAPGWVDGSRGRVDRRQGSGSVGRSPVSVRTSAGSAA